MIHTFAPALLGLAVSLAARALLPGHPAGGIVTTAILGAVGGWVAAVAGERAGLYRHNQPASLIMSVLGAISVILIYSLS